MQILHKGNLNRLERDLERALNIDYNKLRIYALEGVAALASATPVDSGLTAASWDYRITNNKEGVSITWINTNARDRGYVNIAIILQYGHATRTGGYVQGRDYINPAIKPIFDKIEKQVWREVNI